MMTPNPFSDHLYRIDSNEDLYNDKTLVFPATVEVLFIISLRAVPTSTSTGTPSSCEASPASTAPSIPPPPYIPLQWTCPDLNYLFEALYPVQMAAGDILLESYPKYPWAMCSAITLGLYLRSTSTHAPIQPIGTHRPSKSLIAQATASNASLARKELAKQIFLSSGIGMLAYTVRYYTLLSSLHCLPTFALESLRRGIDAMEPVTEREWMGRLWQLECAGVDEEWGFDARFELFLLKGGLEVLRGWDRAVSGALGLGVVQRKELARTYGHAAGFLRSVGSDIA